MKVTLTLNRGSFYFMKNVHLVRGTSTEVDLNTLDKVELAGLKLNIKGGTILADKDITDFDLGKDEVLTVELPKVVEEVPEVLTPDTVEESEPVVEEVADETTEEVVEEAPKETPKRFNKKK